MSERKDIVINTTSSLDKSRKRAAGTKTRSAHLTPTENSPLLPPSETDGQPPGEPKTWRPRLSTRTVTILLILTIFLAAGGDQLKETPEMRLLESVICYRHFEKEDPSQIVIPRQDIGPGAVGGVPELACKLDAVQNQLAMLNGYRRLFEGLPSLVLSIPFGYLADRYGRFWIVFLGLFTSVLRTVFVQGVLCFWQSFPDIRVTWGQAVFVLFSGGDTVTTALFFTTLSDVTPEADRAAVFLRAYAVAATCGAVGPPLSAILMERFGSWVPYLMATATYLLGTVVFTFIPETMGYRDSHSHPPSPAAEEGVSQDPMATTWQSRWTHKIRSAAGFLTNDWRIPTLIALFLGNALFASTRPLLIQYVSKRYTLTFAEGTLLVTVRMAVICVLSFAILPYISTVMMKSYGLSSKRKDLVLTQASAVLVAAGWIAVGLSPNILAMVFALIIGSLGNGLFLTARAFLSGLIPVHHIARVYSIMSVVDTIGLMLGSPLLAVLFKDGLALGGGWIGLPFLALGIFSAVSAVICFLIRLRKDEVKEDGRLVEQEDG